MENLFLTNKVGAHLYHTYAKHLPIIDYHCHLQPVEIYEDIQFEDLGEMWLAHDHYKWRTMRIFGIPEEYITGTASYHDKFIRFAEIFPMLAGNPVYIWCQLELKRYFDIDEPLCAENAEAIYQKTKAMIGELHMTPRYFIAKSNVEYIATTDDPIDDLRYHRAIQDDPSVKTKIVPAFRPDKALNAHKPGFAAYIAQLSDISGVAVTDFTSLIDAIEKRLVFFKETGAGVTDNGLDNLTYAKSTGAERDAIIQKALAGEALTAHEINQYTTAFLVETARLYKRHGFVMQIHIGAYRNANSQMERLVGGDTGFDCTDDITSVRSIGALLDALNSADTLPKVILYPLNSSQFEPLAVLAAAFCTGGVKSRVTLGAPWWFNDQAYGIKKQFDSVGQLYPTALSIGMITDSRSFLSYPRHELYRRVLCNYLGELVERGEYFSGEAALQNIVESVCYRNVKAYLEL